MTETILVWGIVAIVGILSVRSLYRTFSGRNQGCSCSAGSCGKKSTCAVPEAEKPGKKGINE